MIITISGSIGSGKSTVGKRLQKKLGYEYLSTGAIQRKIAADMGLTTLELNHLSDTDPSIDEKIDGYTRALNDSTDDYVVDSRLAWHFIPSSYKVFLLCDEREAARRIFHDKDRVSGDVTADEEALLVKIKERRTSEKERFLEKYEINFEDLSNYDLVIDTTYFTPDEVMQMVIDGIALHDQDDQKEE